MFYFASNNRAVDSVYNRMGVKSYILKGQPSNNQSTKLVYSSMEGTRKYGLLIKTSRFFRNFENL